MRFEPHLWGVVLSGGEGVRLRALTRQICGDERPKQYVPIYGNRTLLRQTLDRVALRIRPSRTAVVTLRSHSRFFGEHWAGSEPPRVLIQPTDRGTAAGILFPIHWIARQDPDAIVAVFPSDHFVSGPATFMASVARIVAWVREHPARLVLLGAHPTSPEVEYGWIELGRRSAGSGRSHRRSGHAYVWKRAVSGTRSSWWARPPPFSAPLGRRFQKSASAWPGPCPSSKATRKPGPRRSP